MVLHICLNLGFYLFAINIQKCNRFWHADLGPAALLNPLTSSGGFVVVVSDRFLQILWVYSHVTENRDGFISFIHHIVFF